MAVKDSKSPHGLHLLIEDYPYVVDGLEIKHGLRTTAPTITRVMTLYKRTLNCSPGGRKLEKRVMVTRKTSPGGLKCKHVKSL